MAFLCGLKLELATFGFTRNINLIIPTEINHEIMKWAESFFSWQNSAGKIQSYKMDLNDPNTIEYIGKNWSILILKYNLRYFVYHNLISNTTP